jgi:hypothetical protein
VTADQVFFVLALAVFAGAAAFCWCAIRGIGDDWMGDVGEW